MLSPAYYTAGVYGWDADIYPLKDGVCIATGYRPFGDAAIAYEDAKKLESAAKSGRFKKLSPDELFKALKPYIQYK